MPTPAVSIAIPAYNRERSVRRAIESALAQTWTDLEVVAVDNCSTDGTWAVLQEYAARDDRVRVFRNDRNLGPQANWRRAIEETHAPYVKLLFSDDWLDREAIALLLPPLRSHAEAAFAYSSFWLHLPDGEPWIVYGRDREGLVPCRDLLWAFASLEPTAAVGRDHPQRFNLMYRMAVDVPITPLPALLRREEALAACLPRIPTRLVPDPNEWAAGNDAYLLWHSCARYAYAYHVPTPTLHADEPDGDTPSMGRDLFFSGREEVVRTGYQNAFAFCLASGGFPARERHALHTAMLITHLQWHQWLQRESLARFGRLFPRGYRWWLPTIGQRRIWRLLVDGAAFRVRRRAGRGSRPSGEAVQHPSSGNRAGGGGR